MGCQGRTHTWYRGRSCQEPAAISATDEAPPEPRTPRGMSTPVCARPRAVSGLPDQTAALGPTRSRRQGGGPRFSTLVRAGRSAPCTLALSFPHAHAAGTVAFPLRQAEKLRHGEVEPSNPPCRSAVGSGLLGPPSLPLLAQRGGRRGRDLSHFPPSSFLPPGGKTHNPQPRSFLTSVPNDRKCQEGTGCPKKQCQ